MSYPVKVKYVLTFIVCLTLLSFCINTSAFIVGAYVPYFLFTFVAVFICVSGLKTKFYKITSLVFFVLISVVALFSQDPVSTIDKLKGNNWKMIFPTEKEYSYIEAYSNDSIITKFSYNTTTVVTKDIFYLSNTSDNTFDFTKVGNTQNGNYIVVLNTRNNQLKKYQIIQLTDTLLELKNTADRSLVLKYEAVSP